VHLSSSDCQSSLPTTYLALNPLNNKIKQNFRLLTTRIFLPFSTLFSSLTFKYYSQNVVRTPECNFFCFG